MASDGVKAVFEIALLLIGLVSFPFGYYRDRGWESTGTQSVVWAVLAAVAGHFCVLLMRAFHDAGGDISGGYEKLVDVIFLLVALPAFASLFGLAAISTYLCLKGTPAARLYYPALALLVIGLFIWVPAQVAGPSQAATSRTWDQTKPQGSTGRDGEEWALNNFPTSIAACKKVSWSKAFVEGCARHIVPAKP